QLEHMGRARIPVELGRLGEPHALAAKQRFDLLRRQRLDGAALLPRIGRSLRHLGRCPGRCRRGRRGQYRHKAKGPYVSHGSISSREPRSPERPLPRPAKSSAPRPDPCPLGGSPPCAGPASGAPWAGLPAAGRSANRRRPMHPPVKRGWFTAPLSLSAITALSIGIACATAAAQEIKLPSTLTVSAYDTGSSGFNMAVAIGKMLKDKHGVDLRVLPGGNDIARLSPVKSGRAAASAMGVGGYFAQEGVFEFGVREWGPQPLQLMLASTSCNGLSLGAAKDAGIKTIADLKGKRVGFVVGSPALNQNALAVLAYAGLGRNDVKIVEFSNYGAMWKGLVNNEADAAFASTISGQARELDAAPRGLL